MPDGQMLKLSQYGLSGVKHNRIEAAFEDAKGVFYELIYLYKLNKSGLTFSGKGDILIFVYNF